MPSGYSQALQELCRSMLVINPNNRPTAKEIIKKILSPPLWNNFEYNNPESLQNFKSMSDNYTPQSAPATTNVYSMSLFKNVPVM